MENPMSWNDTQKLIAAALNSPQYCESHDKVGGLVFNALSKDNLLVERGDRGDAALNDIINTVKTYYDNMEEGMCGLSLPTTIYNMLVSRDHLKK